MLSDPVDVAPYVVDWTGRFRGSEAIVVRPSSTAEVAGVVHLCRESSVPLVPQGGNTGLVGGSVPLHDEVVLSTRRLTKVGPVDPISRQVTVEAGVTLTGIHEIARSAGLRYPVDFGARDSATLGGTIATNAGGISVLRFGMTRRHIVGVEAVLGTGQVVSHLGGLVKDNTGYDIAGLLCGSEGTLGVVTAARLQLVSAGDLRETTLLGFVDARAAMAAVARMCSLSPDIEAMEMFFESGALLVQREFGHALPLRAPVYVLVEVGVAHHGESPLSGLLESCSDVLDVAVASSEATRLALWRVRDEHTSAINRLGPPIKLDVSVPLDRVADFVESVPQVVESTDTSAVVFLFGHAADGNIHVNVTGVAPDSSRSRLIEDVVLAEVVRYGGSVSAEHGIGTAKKDFLHLYRSPSEIDSMRRIKSALDPDGILNPNVLFG